MKVTALKPLPDYRLWLRFSDGVEGSIDLSGRVGRGVFAIWRDPAVFARVKVGEFGQPAWSDEVDLCADALYLEVTGREPADLFSKLKTEAAHA